MAGTRTGKQGSRRQESKADRRNRHDGMGVRRTTVVLPEALDFNLSFYALMQGRAKGEIVRDALAQYIRAHGLDPDRVPAFAAKGLKSFEANDGSRDI